MLSPELKAVLVRRIKTLLWRGSMVFALVIVDFIAQNIGLFNLPTLVTVSAGLVLGEITKFLNSNLKDLISPNVEQ